MCAHSVSTVNVYKKTVKEKNLYHDLLAESKVDILHDLIRLFKWNLSDVLFTVLSSFN